MKKLFMALIIFGVSSCAQTEKTEVENNKIADKKVESIYEFTVTDINGGEVDLEKYKGEVVLIVNTASKCGYTPQYEGLQSIYEEYKESGFVVLGFPSNDFGNQEPGTNEEIKEFCSTNFNVSFPLFDKVKVTGKEKTELYKFLTDNKNIETGEIKWNFEKFLVSRDGEVVARFRSAVEPESEELLSELRKELGKSAG